jgi:two-component system cell cycle response regulator
VTSDLDVGGRPERRGDGRVTESRILVVDDSTAIRRILRRSLEAVGYAVTEVGDGQAALDACRIEAPDLVLLDVDMPVMDGPTALAAMKIDDALREIPVLFLTARTGGSDVAAGLKLGANDYLRKPCDPAELVARVGGALEQKAQQDELRRTASEANRLSTLDVLTGLGNRRQFDERAKELLMIAGGATPIGVVMLDIDHFKQVNDVEGHPVGDMVLRIVAARMRNIVSPPLLLVRWGGEEFLVISPGTNDAELRNLAENIRSAVGDSAVSAGTRLLNITISAGCAAGRLDSLDGVIEQADLALYEAKRGGRNRVVTHCAARMSDTMTLGMVSGRASS